ncbi:NAD(P)/FAD-dependent oxidoreductase [Pedobacter gandavensis]|uniref:NAD(P)/FAD-dependent oxidoreductase n=1 Tax=Pedobacter gandavensis TaxID=2679963 RepID=UPI0029306F98|nr:NAD(P)/FAD-dependent oxidoreductase [Pedobacter gandavensis]
MKDNNQFDIIIIGGSYSGLSAAMALGRALKNVLIIDSGKPCNAQTPFSHNFLTQDGKRPAEIAQFGRAEVERYDTVKFYNGWAGYGSKTAQGFEIQVESGETFKADKLIFATGIKDVLPAIDGFAACWGISAIHCPYCHGYEVKGQKTGILGKGEAGYDLTALISNWTSELTLFTNGTSMLTTEQLEQLKQRKVQVVEKEIERFEHHNGYIEQLIFKDHTASAVQVIYSRNPFEQHCAIPESLGCELSADGFVKVDQFQQTSIAGIFACGDNTTRLRSVANAVAMGAIAGASAANQMIFEQFKSIS